MADLLCECGSEMYRIHGLCSDPQGIREDAFCDECNARYMVTKSSLVRISIGVNEAEVTQENRDLKVTIKTMMKLEDNQNNKGVPCK